MGWGKPTFELSTAMSHYPIGIDSPRADMLIVQDRNIYGAVIETILPPMIFCTVAAVSFLFRMHDKSAFSLRMGIVTSLLITAVLFNLAEQGNIPPVTELTFFNLFMDAVISFLALNLVISAFGYVAWMRSQDKQKVDRINRTGFAIAVLLPIVVFVLLFFLK
jgi:hypothetical protein